MAIIQVVAAAQAVLRGLDYLHPRPPSPVSPSVASVEQVSSLPTWGAVFLTGAAILAVAVSGGWVVPIFVGHAILAGAYLTLGGVLVSAVETNDLVGAALGSLMLAAGLALALLRFRGQSELVRFTASVVLIFGGAWLAADGLGLDFRSATGIVSAGIMQCALLIGLAVLVHRDRQVPA